MDDSDLNTCILNVARVKHIIDSLEAKFSKMKGEIHEELNHRVSRGSMKERRAEHIRDAIASGLVVAVYDFDNEPVADKEGKK